jgi:hypothetical protein
MSLCSTEPVEKLSCRSRTGPWAKWSAITPPNPEENPPIRLSGRHRGHQLGAPDEIEHPPEIRMLTSTSQAASGRHRETAELGVGAVRTFLTQMTVTRERPTCCVRKRARVVVQSGWNWRILPTLVWLLRTEWRHPSANAERRFDGAP